jgi:Na+/H+-dicarboxylate symporter
MHRTAVNVSCDTFAAIIVTKITGIKDEEGEEVYTEDISGALPREDVKV